MFVAQILIIPLWLILGINASSKLACIPGPTKAGADARGSSKILVPLIHSASESILVCVDCPSISLSLKKFKPKSVVTSVNPHSYLLLILTHNSL